jgi:hypothetical protein
MSRIMIAMPTMGSIKTQTVESLFVTIDDLKLSGHQVGFFHLESSDIAMSRNYLASRAIAEGADVLLFIDSDMTFTPTVIRTLLAHGGDVVAAICPKRRIDLRQLVRSAQQEPAADPAVIIARSLMFPICEAADQTGAAAGFHRLTRVGMAVTAIRVGVLRALVERGAAAPVKLAMTADMPTWGFFDPVQTPGARLSEDYSFCSRWADQCGGAIWGLSTAEVGHIGDLVHAGSYADQHPS